MKSLRRLLDRILTTLAGLSFIAMVSLTVWQVLTRYVFNHPSSWSEELVSYLFAWMTLLGASVVMGERGHMNIPVIVERMPQDMQRAMAILAEVIAVIFSAAVLMYGGLYITKLAMGQMTASLAMAKGFFFMVLPLCGFLNVVYGAINIHCIVKSDINLSEGKEM